MHRRFGERMLSVFAPVRRYGCTNQLCAHEAILWKNSALTQRPIVAVAGLIGATLAGALVMGLGLYASSGSTTRAAMRDALMSVLHVAAPDQHDAALPVDAAQPVSRQPPQPEYETASILETNPDAGDLKTELMPPVRMLAPFANPPVLQDSRAELK
jgi:hypothetical protein